MGGKQSKHSEGFVSDRDVATMSPDEKVAYKEKLVEHLKALDAATLPQDQADRSGRVFRSLHFSDQEICEQLVSAKYQTELAAHGWPELKAIGPCFVTLARSGLLAMQRGADVKASVAKAVQQQAAMPKDLQDALVGNLDAVLEAMREIAESYLARGLPKPAAPDDEDCEDRPVLESGKVLKGMHGLYRPVSYINKGSAGVVYAAVKLSASSKAAKGSRQWQSVQRKLAPGTLGASFEVSSDVVLKKINETQKDSAENEYKIASRVAQDGGERYCIPYSDRICEESGDLWLVLKRVKPSSYGIDLTEYIRNGFFQQPGHGRHARCAVLQLLEGLAHVASSAVVMRDVKPDNVLVEFNEAAGDDAEITVRWTDFGLSVDLTDGGNNLRRPSCGSSGTEELTKQLVGWWYDTQKQVPKPKWKHRCPPEGCYQKGAEAAFDVYMVGIIVCCIAAGIDFPHFGSKAVDKEVEELIEKKLPNDYLSKLELGDFVRQHEERFQRCFADTFGAEFGANLYGLAILMLSISPEDRPDAETVLSKLKAA